jgi:hypothetical protein
MGIEEPTDVYPEERFQRAIVAVMHHVLRASGRRFVILGGFGLDIAVFIEAPSGFVSRFIEVKSFGFQRMGGVGFGDRRGQGTQVDLLLTADDCLSLLDSIVRWVFVDAGQPAGSRRYCLFTCETAKAVAMRGVERGKQNNIRISALRERLVDWEVLQAQIEQFVLAEQAIVTGR